MIDPSNFLVFAQFGLIIKLFLAVLAVFYLVFTVIIFRQITLMVQILDSKISPVVQALALGQIAGAALVFLLVVILG